MDIEKRKLTLTKKCPNCGDVLKPRVLRESIWNVKDHLFGAAKYEDKEFIKLDTDMQHEKMAKVTPQDTIMVCSSEEGCAWCENVDIEFITSKNTKKIGLLRGG